MTRKRPVRNPTTVREQIAFSYAKLARAHSALNRGKGAYTTIDHMIHAKLRRGLLDGTMNMKSLYDDERFKLMMPQACHYCGGAERLTMDHLIPKLRGGSDSADNLVWACRSCNSSKGGRDMLEWMAVKGRFPPLLLLRRYIKLATRYCEAHDYLDVPLENIVSETAMPFDLRLLPLNYPPLNELTLWAQPQSDTGEAQTD